MKQHDGIDAFLRELLVNWALEDSSHPIKRATLHALSVPNWIENLYAAENNEKQKEEQMVEPLHVEKQSIRLFDFSEEGKEKLVQHMYEALKKEYEEGFFIKRWGKKKERENGLYHIGPMTANGELFFKIKVGFISGILCWDIEDRGGKVKTEGFEEIPQILAKSLRTFGCDLLIRRLSKSVGKTIYTGKKSASLLFLLQETKTMNVRIKGDEEGNLWLEKGQKKQFRLVPDTSSVPNWRVLDKVMNEKIASFSTKEELEVFLHSLSLKESVKEQE